MPDVLKCAFSARSFVLSKICVPKGNMHTAQLTLVLRVLLISSAAALVLQENTTCGGLPNTPCADSYGCIRKDGSPCNPGDLPHICNGTCRPICSNQPRDLCASDFDCRNTDGTQCVAKDPGGVCVGFCYPSIPCNVGLNATCPADHVCIDKPCDDHNSTSAANECLGICAKRTRTCGNFGDTPCPTKYQCVDGEVLAAVVSLSSTHKP